MIKSLQSLRFVFALLIFHHHFFITSQVDQFGLYPVCFFFVLSGFVMAMGWGNRVLAVNFNYRTYLIKRFIKILPLNLLCLALFLIMSIISDVLNNQIGISKYVFLPFDVLLLQAFFPIRSIYFSGNSVAWFLSVMAFCYFLFPFIFKWLKNRNCIMMIVIIPVIYLFLIQFIKEDLVHSLLYINPFFRIVDFILGIIGYEIVSKVKITSKPSILLTTIETFAILTSVLVFFVYPIVPVVYSKAALFWLPSITLILAFYYSEQSGGGCFAKMLNSRFMVFLGSLSFPFYMLHWIVICWYRRILENHIPFWVTRWQVVFVCVCIITLLAYLYVKYCEPLIVNKLKIFYKI